MKKTIFFLAAIFVALSFASCEVDTSKVTVTVTDMNGNPIADRNIYYTDLASVIIGVALPDPDAPLKDENDNELPHGTTNAQGVVTFTYSLAVSNLHYFFYVYDDGANQWLEKSLKLKRGYNSEIAFQVNK